MTQVTHFLWVATFFWPPPAYYSNTNVAFAVKCSIFPNPREESMTYRNPCQTSCQLRQKPRM